MIGIREVRMSEFDAVVQSESRNMYREYKAALLARYKTEEAAIAGVSSAIYKVIAKYEGSVVTPSVQARIQKDIAVALRSMVTN